MAFRFNPLTSQLDLIATSTSGDVNGPASSTDRAIAIYDGLTGKLIQNSIPIIQSGGAIESQGFLFNRTIENDVTVPDNYAGIYSDILLTTGDIILDGTGEIILI
jgi:hypothetical protein